MLNATNGTAEKFSITSGLDELNLYTANSKRGFFHVKADRETPAYEERYTWAEAFHEGLAVVEEKGFVFHIRPNGAPAYTERYKGVATRFRNGSSHVFGDTGRLVITKNPDGTFTSVKKETHA